MAMNANDRMMQVYNALTAANPQAANMSAAEQDKMKAQLLQVLGTDLAYIQANADVLPGTMQAPAGAQVSTTGGPAAQTGATTSAVTIINKGKVA